MTGKGRRYLFTGGGTAGHVLPNLAICDELRHREPHATVLYLGSRKGYERRLSESGVPFRPVACAPFCSPRRPLRCAVMLLRILLGVLQAMLVMLRWRPHVVVATGGYVSVPVVVAAWILRRRIFLHEQNVHPGLANRFLARLATLVGVSFPETVTRFPPGKALHTGYPVRSQIGEGSSERARREFRIQPDQRVALIFGGSMGSRSINRGTVESLRSLLQEDGIAVVHVTGLARGAKYHALQDTRMRLQRQGLTADIPGRYVCRPFIERIQDAYAMADVVVARAGAGTVMELAKVGKPSILIPKSDAPGNHQLLNALSLQRTGASEVLFEELSDENGRQVARVRGDALAQKIKELLDKRDSLGRMGTHARRLVVDDALGVNTSAVQRLASGEPLVEQVQELDRVGFLMDARGSSHELLFRNNVISRGLMADLRLKDAEPGTRVIVQRTRNRGATEFHLHPRRGRVEVNGRPAAEPVRLEPEDRLGLGGERFTFTVRERHIERSVRHGGIGSKVAATGLGTLVSRIFGFAREMATAALLGLGSATDILAVGLMVSNFLRGVFAEVAVDTALLPTYVHLQRTGRRKEANRLLASMLSLCVTATGVISGVAMLTLPAWLPFVAPGFVDRGLMDQAVTVTRIMFPYLVLVSVAAILGALLRAFDHFAVPAFSSVMFNLGVLGGLAFYPTFGLTAVAWGVLAGGAGQVGVQLLKVLSRDVRRVHGLSLRPRLHLGDQGVKKVGRVTPNILADVSIQKLGSVVDKVLATSLAAGMTGALHFSMAIFRLPYGLISQSLNTVLLKELSDGQAVHDRDWSRRLLVDGLGWTFFTLLPVSFAMLILAEPMVSLLFEYHLFGARDTGFVAMALRLYAVGLVGWGVTGLCGRFFSARLEQPKATATSLLGLGINVGLSVLLVSLGMGIAGLALGTSAAFLVVGAVRLWMLGRSLAAEGVPLRPSDILPSVQQAVIASAGGAVAMVVVHAAVSGFNGLPLVLNRLFVLGVPLLFGAFGFLATALMVGSEQMEDIMVRLRRRRERSGHSGEAPPPVNPYCLKPERLLAWVKAHPGAHLQYNFARRVKSFLGARDWKVRNAAVKLVGELRLKTFRYDLCRIVLDRTPAPLTDRLLGGDFREPGFVRRNAIRSLVLLEVVEPRIEHALMEALRDPYYEVRSGAACALASFAAHLELREEISARLEELTRDRNFEVVQAAVKALGRVASDDRVVPSLKALHYHRNWQVREQVVLAYRSMHERRVIKDPRRLLALLDDVLATSEGFRPHFTLKENLGELQSRLLAESPSEQSG